MTASVGISIALAVVACSCRRPPRAVRVSGVSDADALWGGVAGFCARTPRGLVCWRSLDDDRIAAAPTVVAGLPQVRDVAIGWSRVCAITAGDVACFALGFAPAPEPAFAGATQLVAVNSDDDRICALTKRGVVCESQLVPELGVPDRLIAGQSFRTLCGLQGQELRCLVEEAQNRAVLTMEGVSDPRVIQVSKMSGEVHVLDGETVRYGRFAATLKVGNVFAAKNPLDVDVSLEPMQSAAPSLTTIEGLGPVKALVVHNGIDLLALDRNGVDNVSAHGGNDVELWPIGVTPQALWSGFDATFFTLENGKLHQRGWDRGKRIDHELDVVDPRQVISTLSSTCVREAAGTVTCYYPRGR